METSLTIVGLICVSFNFFLLIFFFKNKSKTKNSDKSEFISIIVAVKNEERNIEQLLGSLTSQSYNKNLYEIIIVDDYSEDDTSKILSKLSSQIPNLVVLSNRNNQSGLTGKKSALSYAISYSKGEILLFTDADCRPGPNWLSSMLTNFADDVFAVIGFSPFFQQTTLVNKIIRYENLKTSFLLSSFFNLGIPYLSFGRNFAYRKKLFNQLKGFTEIEKSISGDDDLFLQQIHKNKFRVNLANEKESHVPSFALNSLSQYLRQKVRHYSASKYYLFKVKFLLGVYYLSNLCLCFLLPISFILNLNYLIIIIAIKFLEDILFTFSISKKLSTNFPYLLAPMFEFIFNIIYLITGTLSLKKQTKW